jgi:hypothetical protein
MEAIEMYGATTAPTTREDVEQAIQSRNINMDLVDSIFN